MNLRTHSYPLLMRVLTLGIGLHESDNQTVTNSGKLDVILTGILSGCLARTLSPSALLTSSGTERWYWLPIWKQPKDRKQHQKTLSPSQWHYLPSRQRRKSTGWLHQPMHQCIQSTSDTARLKGTSLFTARWNADIF